MQNKTVKVQFVGQQQYVDGVVIEKPSIIR